MPAITVLMTTLNSGRFVKEAIESILQQTFCDWELLIIDGGSEDDTVPKIRSFSDPRIQLVVCPGLRRSAQLNYGLSQITSPYVAIMDSDDVALPKRLEMEYQFLSEHCDIDIVGSWAELIDEEGKFLKILKKSIYHDDIINRLTINAFPSFPSILFRKNILDHKTFLNLSLKSAVDYDWYIRISEFAKMENIPVQLMKLRQTHNSLSRTTVIENNTALISSIDTYFNSCREDDPRPILRLHGIAHYYYGSPRQAKSLLLRSLRREGIHRLTLRYLLPLLILNEILFNKARKSFLFRMLGEMFRKMESRC